MLQSGSSAYDHGPLHCMIVGSDDSHDFEELDPSGRYGRYKDVLGKGAFKVVYKGFDVVDGIEVAWNQIKVKNALHSAEDIEQFYSEVHLLKTLKHKNIIKFYHSWVDTEAMNINFLTEIFTSGTLRQYRKRHKRIDIRAVKKWSRQILRGLLYLHSQDPPVIHRDLKCDNIFINGNQGEVKIGDLGLATILNQAHAAQTVIGTPEFMAPELYEEEYTELVDIYSFGMCLLEMITGEYPYSECSNAAQIYKKVTLGKKPAALNKVKNLQLRLFVEKCIATASRRLPARELLMDPFLQGDEVGDITRDAHSICQPASNLISLSGSFSDIRTTLMDQTLASARSFSSLKSSTSSPNLYQEFISTPMHSALGCGHLAQQHNALTPVSVEVRQNDLPPSCPIEGKVGRIIDFQIKGKKLEDAIIQLRLRIADTEGEVRVIHFPFDVVHDTALSVAVEMVEDLDLIDQDVTKIAGIIDDAIQIMVPNYGYRTSLTAAYIIENQGLSNANNSCEHSSVMSLESSISEQPQTTLPSWQHEPSLAALKHLQMESTIHGRFEEIAYHQNGTVKNIPPLTNDDCYTTTSTSSEESWDSLNSLSLHKSFNGKCSYQSGAC
ncbi:hypothetical protein GOP47_0000323 [Adiantum capillus-veneris]|uniref:non-specific serine/threonine protein kinase n=1 Tax=Adiantum capillus-veneris TaxID=13818 RepID=A0A9D4VDP3_ADICA|nr:hypothetical protein GOP47_0000323 [Adiantum capillus-veneris]